MALRIEKEGECSPVFSQTYSFIAIFRWKARQSKDLLFSRRGIAGLFGRLITRIFFLHQLQLVFDALNVGKEIPFKSGITSHQHCGWLDEGSIVAFINVHHCESWHYNSHGYRR
ncbi:MAG: hypothetical protein JW884_08965, partial [Deltaproteobacteria bacterium]|nr:hypothetical protein [Deltaproteobacteria bacterium]